MERRPVVIVVSSLSPMNGLESTTVSLAHALSRDRDVRIVTLADSADELEEVTVPVESWGSRLTGWQRLRSLGRAARHCRKLDRSTVILSGAWASVPLLAVLPRRIAGQAVVWEHSFGEHQVESSKNLALLRFIARFLYRRARSTVVVSEALKRDMSAYGFPPNIEVIPNIVRRLSGSGSGDAVEGRLLAVGSLTKNKNQVLALQALALLPQRYVLDVVGDGPERTVLEQVTRQLGLTERVTFHGYIDDPSSFFSRSQVLIHPSFGETFGLVLFEAADFHTPVVALRQSVMPQIIPRLVPGVLSDPDAESFAAAIASLESSPISIREYERADLARESQAASVIQKWRDVLRDSL